MSLCQPSRQEDSNSSGQSGRLKVTGFFQDRRILYVLKHVLEQVLVTSGNSFIHIPSLSLKQINSSLIMVSTSDF